MASTSVAAKVADDIWLEIFHILSEPAQAISHGYSSQEQECDPRIPIAISHVCSNWRSLALASPRLWSGIPLNAFAGCSMLCAFLDRAGDALRVLLTVTDSYRSHRKLFTMAGILADHSHRFISLHIYGIPNRGICELLALFKTPPMQLRSLHIYPSMLSMSLAGLDESAMSSLTRLLSGSNLTELHVDDLYVTDDALLNILWNCPHLQDLRWSRQFPAHPISNGPAQALPPLFSLRKLHLVTPAGSGMSIIPRITFPRTTEIVLDDYIGTEASPASALARCPPAVREMATLAEAFTLDTAFNLGMSGDESYRIAVARGRLTISGSVYSDEMATFVDIPFTALRSLTIRGPCRHVSVKQWQQIFRRFPALTHLELDVDDQSAKGALGALSTQHPRRWEPQTGTRTLLCPHWTSLVLVEHIVFSEPAAFLHLLHTTLQRRMVVLERTLTACELVGRFWESDGGELSELQQLISGLKLRRKEPKAHEEDED